MKRVYIDDSWPDSWKYSYQFDLQEVYGEITNLGYAYAYQTRRQLTLRLLTEALPPGARVLDVAAAQGNFSLLLAEMGYQVTWNDLREDLADYVRLKHEYGDIEYAPGNAFELNFDDPFDAILITEIIEHVAHPDMFLSNAAKLVKPGGYILMTTPNGAYFNNRLPKFSECLDPSIHESGQFKPDSDGHIFLLHPEEVETLSGRVGLQIEKNILFINPLTNGRRNLGALLKFLPGLTIRSLEVMTQYLPFVIRKKLMVHIGTRFRKIGD